MSFSGLADHGKQREAQRASRQTSAEQHQPHDVAPLASCDVSSMSSQAAATAADAPPHQQISPYAADEMRDTSPGRCRRSSSPGLVVAGSDGDLRGAVGGGGRSAARVLSEGQVPGGGGGGGSGGAGGAAHSSISRLSVGEQPSPSQLSLGQHSVGEDVSVERRHGEEGEVAAARPAGSPPHCQCTLCAARTSTETAPVAGTSEEDPQLERLCRHTVEMMKLDGATEEEKQRLVKQLQEKVSTDTQSAPPPTEPFPFQALPAEIRLLIFSFLSPQQLCTSVFPVCRDWYAMGRDPVLWQHLSFEVDTVVLTRTVVHILSFSTLLKTLRLEARRYVDKILFQVADTCKQLRQLTAKFCDGLNSLLLEVLVKHCPHIERLDFEGSRFEDPGCMSALTGLAQLKALNVSHCLRLEDAELGELARACPRLEELNVDGIGYLTDAAVLDLVQLSADRLVSLVLDGENLSDVAFTALGSCRNLQSLSISFADNMTDASLPSLGLLRDLLRLKVRRGHQLSAVALARLFDGGNMPQLLHLDLSECSNVDDRTLDAITAHCPLLTFLALSWCWDITDVGLERIVTRLRFMRVLDLIGVVRITGRCFRLIPERLPQLRYLNLEQCSDVEDLVVERVVRQRPQLQALDYYGDRVVPRPEEMEGWAEEVGDRAHDIQLPITINFVALPENRAS